MRLLIEVTGTVRVDFPALDNWLAYQRERDGREMDKLATLIVEQAVKPKTATDPLQAAVKQGE